MRRLYEGHDSCLFQHRENSGRASTGAAQAATSSGKTCCSLHQHRAAVRGAATGQGNRTTVPDRSHLYGRVSVVLPEHAVEAEIKNSDRHLREQRPWVCGLERSGVWLSVDGKGFPQSTVPRPQWALRRPLGGQISPPSRGWRRHGRGSGDPQEHSG